jgi:DNA-directed RNA polymerase subunit RPC12/RpoP
MDIDRAAHGLYSLRLIRKHAPAHCRRCGTTLETAYHEDRLYSVACPDCKTVTLVKARNPAAAAQIVGNACPTVPLVMAPAGQYSEETLRALERMGDQVHSEEG